VSWSSPEIPGIPRTSEGTPNWAADTDPVGFGVPEPAPGEPDPSNQQLRREEGMSTAEFGDPNNGQAFPPVPAPDGLLGPLSVSPAAPVDPLVQPTPLATPQPAAPVTPVEPEEAPAVPVQDMRDVPLGTLIFRAGLLTEEQLEAALQDGIHRGKRLGEVLLERGLVSEGDLGRLLAGQKGLRFVELDAASIDPAAVQLLPVEKARLHSMLPIGFHDGLPVVAVADPSNDLVIENVRRAMNCEPHLVVAGREALHRQIELAYGVAPQAVEPVAVTPEPVAEPVPPVAPEPQPVVAAPAPPATPLVVQPQAPPGEGIWLGAPQPAAQAEQVFQTPEPPPVVAQGPPPVVAQEPEPVVAQEPEPVIAEEPQPTVTPEPQPTVTPELVQPVVPAEPVQPLVVEQSVAEPLSITYTPVEPAETPPPLLNTEPLAAAEPVFAQQPEVETAAPSFDEQTSEPEEEGTATWTVVLRLTGGEQIDIGSFRSSDEAKEHAQGVVRQISSDFGWPFFDGRFIRPDVIVSVDLVAPEGDRWLGSSARRQWAQPD
jgi:Type II secretion system (T2SS), protein E, N-terminal domain